MTKTSRPQGTALRAFTVLTLLAGLTATGSARAQTTASGHVALQGTYIEVGVNRDGYFGFGLDEVPAGYHTDGSHNGNGLGFIADYRKNGWSGQWGGDYFTPGSPFEGFMLAWDGVAGSSNLTNAGGGSAQISTVSLVDGSAGDTHTATWTGDASNGSESFRIIQTYSFRTNDLYFTANVQIVNTGVTSATNLRFARVVDPDNDETWSGGSFTTVNQVVNQPSADSDKALVTAAGTGVTDMVLGLGAFDARAVANAGGAGWFGSVDAVLSPIVTAMTEDTTIGLAFRLGDLAPGLSVTFDYAYILSLSDLDVALGALAAVTIRSPSGSVSGSAVPFDVVTADMDHTSRVELYLDGVLFATLTSPTGDAFSATFDSTLFADGPLAVKAVATIGGVAAEKSATITVSNAGAPIAFDAPTSGAAVTGDGLAVQVSGTEPGHLPVQVTFYREVAGQPSVSLGTVSTVPFATVFDTSDLLGGSVVTLRAIAVDALGHTTNVAENVVVALTGASLVTSAGTTSYSMLGTPAKVDARLRLVSPADLDGATASITVGLAAGEDLLAFVPTAGVTGLYDGATGVLTLTGTAPAATYQAILRSVVFATASSAAPEGARTVTFGAGGAAGAKGVYAHAPVAVSFVSDGTPEVTFTGETSQLIPFGGATSAVTVNLPAGLALDAWVDQNGGRHAGNPVVLTGVTESLTLTATLMVPLVPTLTAIPSGGNLATTFDLTVDVSPTDVCGVAYLFIDWSYHGAAWYDGPDPLVFSLLGSDVGVGLHDAFVSYDPVCGSYSPTDSSHISFTVYDTPTLVTTSGGVQSTTAGQAFASPICVEVRDGTSTLMVGEPVTFSVPPDGATATLTPGSAGFQAVVATDANGIACVDAAASAQSGSYLVTGQVQGTASPVAQLTNTPVPQPTSIATTSGAVQSAPVGQLFASPVCVEVRDQLGNLMVGLEVRFGVPGTGATAAVAVLAVTDANGTACTSATASTVVGAYLVIASAGEMTAEAAALANLAGPPHHVAYAAPGGAQSATVGSAFDSPLGVVVLDAYDNPVPGVTVAWALRDPAAAAKATLSTSSAVTGGSGQAEAGAIASTRAGTYAVDVTVGGLTIDPAAFAFQLTNLAGPPAAIAVVAGATPQTAAVGGLDFAHPLGVGVTDLYGNPVAGATVTFAAPAGGATAALSSTTAPTDASGRAQVTASTGDAAGAFTVTASIQGGSSTTFSLTDAVGAPSALALSTGQGQHATVGTAFTIDLAVTLRDRFGNPVSGALVSLAAPSSGASATLSAAAVTTDAAGQASAKATASTISGAYQVTASVSGAVDPQVFDLANDPGAPTTVTTGPLAATQSAEVGTAFANALAVTVVDQYGNPVPGVTVTWAAPTAGATAVLSATSATTDATGSATRSATAGVVAGGYRVIASVAGVTAPAGFDLTNLHGAPGSIAVVSGSPQHAVVGQVYGAPLEVVVRDAHGNAVQEAMVAFAAPAAGARATLSAAAVQTGADGHATVGATAGTVAGAFQVTASVAGAGDPVQLALENQAGAPLASVVGPSSSPQSTRVGEPFATPLSVTVVDQYGNPVPGVAVAFACPSSGVTCTLAASSVLTNPQGQAQVGATAGTIPGEVTATATVAGLSPVSYSLTSLVGLPGSIASLTGATQSATVYAAFGAPLSVVVKDAYQNVVPGAAVSFADVSSGTQGAVLSAAATVTDASGQARITAAANGAKGAYSVSASVAGAASPASFAMTNRPVATTLGVEVTLPVYTTVVVTGGITRVRVTVGPEAGGHPAGGTVTLSSTRPVEMVPGQEGVTASGGAVVGVLLGGAAEIEVRLGSWRSQTLTVAYQPDPASDMTWDAVSVTQTLRAPEARQSNGGGGCSAGGAGPLALLPLLLLALRVVGRRRRWHWHDLAALAVLAGSLAPTAARAQLVPGVRVGYAFSAGDLSRGVPMSDGLRSQAPVQLDLGWQVLPRLVVGGYGAYGIGRLGSRCGPGADCSGSAQDLGVQATWRFRLARVSPWAGAGLGYEWGRYLVKVGADRLDVRSSGPELRLMGGVDLVVGDRYAIGPFGQWGLGRYADLDATSPLGYSSGTIPDKTVHSWFTIGVRGSFETIGDGGVASRRHEAGRAAAE